LVKLYFRTAIVYLARLVAIALVVAANITGARSSEPIRVEMSAQHWRMLEADSMGPKGQAEFHLKEGFPQGLLVLKAGSAELDGLTFRDGTIEYDFKSLAADMPAVQFRVRGPDKAPDGEEVYERLFGDERASNDGIQYAPMIHGFMLWDTYPQYQGPAPLIDGWNHVRVVVSGQRIKVYVNRSVDPVLSVGNLESGSAEGALRLRGPGIFANLIVLPDKVDRLPPQPEPDVAAHDPGMVRHWQTSPLTPLLVNHAPGYEEMPRDASAWRDISSERGGLVNLNRQHTLSDEPAAIGWLRFLVTAQQASTRRLQLGWLGEVWVFVNGKPVATAKNFYDPENERRDPDGRLSLQNDTMDLPLQAGLNEVAIALHASVHDDMRPQTKYGWGLVARFPNPTGLTFPAPRS